MVGFVRSLFESALKTNDHLQFAVITGCLRISKEIMQMMEYYDVKNRFATMKEWYDGYLFGDTEVYNPWSVIKFLYDLFSDVDAFPRPYWINTSSNDIIKYLIMKADRETKEQIELLLKGETLDIPVHEEITYEDMHGSGDNLWNFLFLLGF